MADEKNAFYAVRKGDIVGIFKSLSDCQMQVSMITDPAVSVYKGYSLPKEAEEHLSLYGLKNPCYVIGAAHLKEDLLGPLVPCPFQQPIASSATKGFSVASAGKRPYGGPQDHENEWVESSCISKDRLQKLTKLGESSEVLSSASKSLSCLLEFDGASKGNPGKAGAGAILRSEDGKVWRLCEGLGIATNNVAEYRAMILGLKYALRKGFKNIWVQGDSKLVCMQVQGHWQTKNQNMAELCKEAKELVKKFVSFKINHVDRELNSEADVQANRGVNLEEGEIREDFELCSALC